MNCVSWFFCFVLSTLIGTSFAQSLPGLRQPSKAEIEDRLASQEPLSVAWGAHYAAATKDQAVVPAMVSLADNWQSMSGSVPDPDHPDDLAVDQLDRQDAMAAVLDALIQMHAVVSVGSLRNLATDFPNYVAILLSRLPLEESRSLSLEFYRSEPKTRNEDNLQYVSAVLLAQAPPSGFAADLFSSIHNRTKIFIVKPGTARKFGGSGGAGCCFVVEPRKEWPEFGIYSLSEGKLDGGFAIVTGANPVYAVRSETTHYLRGSCGDLVFAVLGAEQRRRLVAQMLNIRPDDIDWENELEDTVEFKSEKQFYQELRRLISEQQDDYGVTAEALVAKSLMTVSEQEESLPYIDLYFEDQRDQDSSPIPAPASLPPHVIWHDQP